METNMIKSAVCSIIVGNEILLLERPIGDYVISGWCLPGGKLETGETSHSGAIRETFEETGIDASNPRYCGDYVSAMKENIVSAYFKIFDQKPDVTISEEHTSYKWVSLDQVTSIGLAGNTEIFIKAALSTIRNSNVSSEV